LRQPQRRGVGGEGYMKFEPGETNIICTNIENSFTFYKDVLGFEFVEKEGIATRLRNGNHMYLLLPAAKSPGEIEPYCSKPEYSIDLLTDNLKEAVKHLKAGNVAIIKQDEYSAIIRDPDGLVIEVIQKF